MKHIKTLDEIVGEVILVDVVEPLNASARVYFFLEDSIGPILVKYFTNHGASIMEACRQETKQFSFSGGSWSVIFHLHLGYTDITTINVFRTTRAELTTLLLE